MKGSRRLRTALIVLFSLGVNIEARSYTSIFYENRLYNPVGTDTRAFVLADLDGDGDVDLASANFGSNDVTVLLNEGDLPFRWDRNYWVGPAPHSIVGADLDGDGDVDLAVGSLNDDTVSILFNKGDGRFADKQTYDCCEPYSMSGMDLEGDGDVDLVVATTIGEKLILLFNEGDGTFPLRTEYFTEGEPIFASPADVDSDGDVDLIVSRYGVNHALSVLLNTGAGTFQEQATFHGREHGLCTGDFDGDGDVDFANSGGWGYGIVVFLNDGRGGFGAGATYGESERMGSSVFAADLDGDSDLDLAAIGSGRILILLNAGDGTFPESAVYETLGGRAYEKRVHSHNVAKKV